VKPLVVVSLGGIIGSLLRWQISETLPRSPAIAVFIINQIGVGVAAFMAYRVNASELRKLFLITGFAGGFTTFSALAVLTQQGTFIHGAVFVALSLIASLIIMALIRPKSKK